jgi:hypothetical protein
MLLAVSNVLSPRPQELDLAMHKTEKDQHLALGGLGTDLMLKPNQPCLCVESSYFYHSLRNVSQTLPVDMGQVFCGNSFQYTQVQ